MSRCRDVALRGGGSATDRHGLNTCHPEGAPIVLKEGSATVTELYLVWLISEGLEIIVGLLVGEEVCRVCPCPRRSRAAIRGANILRLTNPPHC